MRGLDAVLQTTENALGWIGKIALFAMMLLVSADAGGRYFFNSPVSGVYEITEFYLMMAVVFLGLAMTQTAGGHVRVELLVERLPTGVQRLLEILFLLVTLVVFALVAYGAARTSLQNIELNRWTTGVVAIPTGPSWAIAAIGSAAFCLRLLFQAIMLCLGADLKRQQTGH